MRPDWKDLRHQEREFKYENYNIGSIILFSLQVFCPRYTLAGLLKVRTMILCFGEKLNCFAIKLFPLRWSCVAFTADLPTNSSRFSLILPVTSGWFRSALHTPTLKANMQFACQYLTETFPLIHTFENWGFWFLGFGFCSNPCLVWNAFVTKYIYTFLSICAYVLIFFFLETFYLNLVFTLLLYFLPHYFCQGPWVESSNVSQGMISKTWSFFAGDRQPISNHFRVTWREVQRFPVIFFEH